MSSSSKQEHSETRIDQTTGVDVVGHATATTTDTQLGVETSGELLVSDFGDTIQLIASGDDAEVALSVDRDELKALLL